MNLARAAALTLALMVAGCSEDPTAGVDLVTYVGDGFSVSGPRGWEACRRAAEGGQGASSLEIAGPPGPLGFPPVVQMSNLGTERPFGHAVRFQLSLLTLSPGFHEVSDEAVEVTGAAEARSVRFTQEYPAGAPGGAPIPVSGGIVFAAGPEGDVMTLTTVSHADDAESLQVTFDAVAASLDLTAGATEGSPVDELPSC